MFLDFFFSLKKRGVPVSIQELFDLLHVLRELLAQEQTITPLRFHRLARLTLVKDIKYYDDFDQVFAQCFQSLLKDDHVKEKLEEWLNQALKREISEEQKSKALQLPPEELLRELEKRFQEQKEQHHGGNHWIGTGGTSPFGHSGHNTQGVRIGGQSQGKSALAVMGERRFKEYRTDETLDLRNIKVALKGLRLLKKQGAPVFSLEKTIDQTCKRGGEIEIVEEATRKNTLKLLLFLDVGGSMTPYAQKVSKLFSALNQLNHFKEFKTFYFHNIFYDHVYTSPDLILSNAVLLQDLMKRYDSETRIIVLGDAAMAPFEYFQMSGLLRHAYDYYGRYHSYPLKEEESKTGEESLKKLSKVFSAIAWLNPDPKDSWKYTTTTQRINQLVPMYPLTIDGLNELALTLTRQSSLT